MCQAIQEMRKESEWDGKLKKARKAAGKLYEMGLDTEKIAQAAIQNGCHRKLDTVWQK